MDPITIGLLILASTLVSQGIQQHYQSQENERAMNENKQLSTIQRADALKQRSIDNSLNEQKIKAAQKNLSFSEKMQKEMMKDQTQQTSYLYNKANKSFQVEGAKSALGITPDDLDKRSFLNQRGY